VIAIFIDHKLQRYENQIKFAFNFIFRTLGYEYKFASNQKEIGKHDIVFYYAETELSDKGKLQLGKDRLLCFIPCFKELLIPGKIPKTKLREYTQQINIGDPLPIICDWQFRNPIIYLKNEQVFYVKFHFDLLANVFFNLCNYETVNAERDSLGRIPDSEYLHHDFFYYPYVNAMLWFIEQVLKDAVTRSGRCFLTKKEMWPAAQDYGFAVSHQLDRLQKWTVGRFFKSFFKDLLLIIHVKYVCKNLYSKLKYILTNIEEYWNFDEIEEIENETEFKSTFFLGSEHENEYDVDYDLDDRDLLEELERIEKQNKEIALLGSYQSAKSDILSHQKHSISQLINKHKIGIRQICFRYFPEFTAEYHYKHSFFYDSSQTLLTRPGFKCGIALPYHPYAVNDATELIPKLALVRDTILELPLAFRASSLKKSPFSIIEKQEAKKLFNHTIKGVKQYGGFYSMDFTCADFAEIDYLKGFYSEILQQVDKDNCYKATYKQIADWWKKRENVQITDSKDDIIIHFPDHLPEFVLTIVGNNSFDSVENDKNREDENQIFLPYYDKQNTFEFNGTKVKFAKDRIFFSEIKPDTRLRIKLSKKEIEKEA
jgi:hypothetical protein